MQWVVQIPDFRPLENHKNRHKSNFKTVTRFECKLGKAKTVDQISFSAQIIYFEITEFYEKPVLLLEILKATLLCFGKQG